MDLDQIISNTRKCVRQLGKLDIEEKYESYSMDFLMASILEEQRRMRDEKEIPIIESKEIAAKVNVKENFYPNTPAREYDRKLSSFKIYRVLRPFIKKVYRKFRPLKEVDGRSLLQYHNKEFIKVAYRSILLREVDEQAFLNAEQQIKKQTLSRYELLYNLTRSEEGKKIGIKVTHIGFAYYKERCWKIVKKIPVIGYLLNWIRSFILLPKSIYTLQKNIIDIVIRLDWIEERERKYEEKYQQLQKKLEETEQNWNQRLELTERLQEHTQIEKREIRKKIERLYEREERQNQNIQNSIKDMQEYVKTERIEIKEEIKRWYKREKKEWEDIQNFRLDIEKKIEQNQLISEDAIIRLIDIEKEIEQKKKEKLSENQYKKEIMDLFYLHYNETLMPDSRENVEERQNIYLPEINEWCKNIEKSELHMIDLGCGEGEFLELMRKHNYPIYGIDNNSMVIKKVRTIIPDLKVIEADALEYLGSLENNSVDFISCIHMIEHLEFIEIIELLKECYRVLRRNGLLILETPNPLNILIATYYFYLDPTHKKPIPYELLKYFLTESGFEIKKIQMLRPLNFCSYSYDDKEDKLRDIVFRFNMEQAYSIMAVKTE